MDQEVGNFTYFFHIIKQVIYINNFILQYYGIHSFEIIDSKECFIVKSFSKTYYLVLLEDDVDISLSYQLSFLVPFSYRFVFNCYHDFVSSYQGSNYVLLEDNYQKEFSLSNLFSFVPVGNRIKLNWNILWINRIEYLEEEYISFRGKYPLIDESIDYYFSMFDLAISLLSDYVSYYDIAFVQHKNINNNFFNPLYFCIDFKERDFSNFLKKIFWDNTYHSYSISDIILSHKSDYNFDLVISRLLYPDYYFNTFLDIINLKKEEKELCFVIDRVVEYENYISFILNVVNSFYPTKKVVFQT